MKKFIHILVLMLAMPMLLSAQQEVTYSQYMFNNLLVNPAYAGYKESININLLNRNQWVGVNGAPVTQSFIIDGAFFNNNNVGLGLAVLNDKAGLQGQTSVLANYAYRLPVGYNDARLSFGIGVGATQYSLNADKAIVGDKSDLNFTGNRYHLSPNASLGLFYNDDRFYAGLSANNLLTNILNKKNNSSNDVVLPPIHMFLTVGALIDVNNDVKFKPSLMYRDDPRNRGNFDVNASFLFKDVLWLGASYRLSVDMWKKNVGTSAIFQQNSLVGLVEVYVAKSLRLGYAYDYGLSKLKSLSAGSHEFSIGLILGNQNYRNNGLTTPRYF